VGSRVLITGLSSFWGGRLALAFEANPGVDVVVGVDTADPVVALERTEFVRTDENYSILARLIRATQVDTVIHTALIVDSSGASEARLHELNVIGTINLLAAAGGADSNVTALVVKSSTLVYGCSNRDPTWFREDTPRSRPPHSALEQSLVEAESYLQSFAAENRHTKVAILRCANVLGDDLVTPLSRALSMPLIPTITGFDPQIQFVEQDDVIRAIEFVVARGLDGDYNLAADGRLPWSEMRAIAGRLPLLLSPVLTELAVAPLSRAGLVNLPRETLDLLRFGRGVDNRKLKDAGFSYRFSTAGTVRHFVEADRLRRVVGETHPTYRYEGDVESFFRHSRAVVRS
jgi:UDP-glucose 4-epimerase